MSQSFAILGPVFALAAGRSRSCCSSPSACLASLLVGASTAAMLLTAWVYVALRVAHTMIHVTYNDGHSA